MNKENFYERRENIMNYCDEIVYFEQRYDDILRCNLCNNNITINELKFSCPEYDIDVCCECEHKIFMYDEQKNISYQLKCINCNNKTTDKTHVTVCKNLIFCIDCYQDYNNVKNKVQSLLYTKEELFNSCFIERYHIENDETIIINKYKRHDFTLPYEIYEQTSEERDNDFICDLGELVNVCDKDILMYTAITDYEEYGFYPAGTWLAVKCEYPYPVISGCADDHDRISYDKLYDTYEEYLMEKSQWSLSPNVNEEIKRVENELRNGDIDEHDCLKACKTFSQYIRMYRRLDMYFG